jgi:SAM-dependent methyltransferase
VPPIDCPLRRAGVDPSALHPFAEAEAYIAFLERADRAGWQRPEAVVAALGLSGRELVADYGAGSGYFTFRLARALPAGRVRAIDVQPEMVRHVHHRALSEGVANVEARLATADDVQLSGDEDLVFVCDVLHHVPDRAGLLRTLFAAMKPDARLVLLEFREGELPQGPPESVKIPRAALLSLATDAGFALAVEHADLVPYQHVLEFRRP